ncbi:MAG: FAD-dependent oxidoreductase, partial [Humibacter sp.]
LEPVPVTAIIGNGTEIDAVRLDDGREVAVDAIFTAGAPRPHDDFLAPLGLDRNEGSFGSFLTVDFAGRTSEERIWAVGNVVNPTANVPMSIGAGALTGGAVNGALVGWDFDLAMQAHVVATGS